MPSCGMGGWLVSYSRGPLWSSVSQTLYRWTSAPRIHPPPQLVWCSSGANLKMFFFPSSPPPEISHSQIKLQATKTPYTQTLITRSQPQLANLQKSRSLLWHTL